MTNEEMNNMFTHAYIWMVKHNQTNSNPYHNDKHMLFVFQMAMQIFDKCKKEYGLKSNDRMELGLAAIFHDMNHSGGKLKDSENIDIAIQGFNEYINEFPEIPVSPYKVIELIKSTEFPHKEFELNPLQKIIRDADTMGGISDSWLNIITALSSEYGKTLEEFIPIQMGFLDKISFNTDYCNQMLEERRDKIKKDLLKLQSDLFFK